MARLIVQVEGVTEENFVNAVLRDHLILHGHHEVSARRMGNARLREQRHGIKPWTVARKDIVTRLKENAAWLVTTFVDFYRLPLDWPGREAAAELQHHQKGLTVENAIIEDLADTNNAHRVIPFVMVHEFEALLFSDCAKFSESLQRPELGNRLLAIRNSFSCPEEINGSPETAPSKRLEALLPYRKALDGPAAAQAIGLERMRTECPHFDDWLSRLEAKPQGD